MRRIELPDFIKDLDRRLRTVEFRLASDKLVKPQMVKASAQLNGVTTITDIPGCSITFDVRQNHTVVHFAYTTHFDIDGGVASRTTAQGRLDIDGTTYDGSGADDPPACVASWAHASTDYRGAPTAFGMVELGQGQHTVKLRAIRNTGSATVNVLMSHTRLSIVGAHRA